MWSDNLVINGCGLQLCVIQSVIQEKGALKHFDGSLWRINFPVSVISVVNKLLIDLNTYDLHIYCISRFTVRASNGPLIKLDYSYVVRVSAECFRYFLMIYV